MITKVENQLFEIDKKLGAIVDDCKEPSHVLKHKNIWGETWDLGRDIDHVQELIEMAQSQLRRVRNSVEQHIMKSQEE